MARLKYSPLATHGAFIRMLAILPSMRKSSKICVNLVLVDLNDLDSAPFAFYEALSYTWGDASLPRVECKLNGHKHSITRNLDAALRQLRARTRKRYLWVDALCINQEDLAERAQQVQMMRRIYESAEQVIVWLGAAADDSDRAIATLDYFTDADCPDDILTSILSEAEKPRWTAVAKLLDREWFRRVWVRQEIAVAKAAWVMCGKDMISWDTLVLASDMLTAPDVTTDFSLLVTTISNRGSGAHWTSTIEMFRETYAEHGGHDLAELMLHARGADVTDGRDRVYGLLGLSHLATRIQVDYTLTAREVFTRAMATMLRHKQSLDSLSGCSLSARSDPAVPSWVYDLDVDFGSMVLRSREGGEALFNAALDEQANFDISEDSWILKATGFVYDRIEKTEHCFPEDEATYFNGHHVGRWLDLAVEVLRQRDPDLTDFEIMRRFCRMLVADTNDRGDRAEESLWTEHCQTSTLQTLPSTLQQIFDQESVGFAARMAQVCHGRAMLTTENGCIGLSDKACQEGDLVCVLFGARVPFILRPEAEHFYLVGEAYVQGIMDGEAVREMRTDGVLTVQFDIR